MKKVSGDLKKDKGSCEQGSGELNGKPLSSRATQDFATVVDGTGRSISRFGGQRWESLSASRINRRRYLEGQ